MSQQPPPLVLPSKQLYPYLSTRETTGGTATTARAQRQWRRREQSACEQLMKDYLTLHARLTLHGQQMAQAQMAQIRSELAQKLRQFRELCTFLFLTSAHGLHAFAQTFVRIYHGEAYAGVDQGEMDIDVMSALTEFLGDLWRLGQDRRPERFSESILGRFLEHLTYRFRLAQFTSPPGTRNEDIFDSAWQSATRRRPFPPGWTLQSDR